MWERLLLVVISTAVFTLSSASGNWRGGSVWLAGRQHGRDKKYWLSQSLRELSPFTSNMFDCDSNDTGKEGLQLRLDIHCLVIHMLKLATDTSAKIRR